MAGIAQQKSAGSFTEAGDAAGQPGARVERSGEDDGRAGKPCEAGSQVTVILLPRLRQCVCAPVLRDRIR